MRPERDRLSDMLSAIRAIENDVVGMDETSFLATFGVDSRFADAICFRLIVIGEAVAALREAARRDPAAAQIIATHPEIDWRGYVGMRNIVAHRYFRRDPAPIWLAIRDELPALRSVVEEALSRP